MYLVADSECCFCTCCKIVGAEFCLQATDTESLLPNIYWTYTFVAWYDTLYQCFDQLSDLTYLTK